MTEQYKTCRRCGAFLVIGDEDNCETCPREDALESFVAELGIEWPRPDFFDWFRAGWAARERTGEPVKGLALLQIALDANELPDSWPIDVCRDAWCGCWERRNGEYYWHTEADHS